MTRESGMRPCRLSLRGPRRSLNRSFRTSRPSPNWWARAKSSPDGRCSPHDPEHDVRGRIEVRYRPKRPAGQVGADRDEGALHPRADGRRSRAAHQLPWALLKLPPRAGRGADPLTWGSAGSNPRHVWHDPAKYRLERSVYGWPNYPKGWIRLLLSSFHLRRSLPRS